ncbi:MAG: hypothetical protein FE78DRAFT_534213 [Acidomyces sp. 'richmondensis']|nr:MAG: hypothetical protein FE78DRAFT_534213 [Acidomyces sp. 'richmondensis']
MGQSLSFSVKGKHAPTDPEHAQHEKSGLPIHEPQMKDEQLATNEFNRSKFLEDQCCIQPHTDEGGDAYYIGDAYEPAKCAGEWKIDESNRPYLKYIKRISHSLPHLEYLAHWMEVTAAPPKWKFIKQCQPNREERARRCNVCVMDFNRGQLPETKTYTDVEKLNRALEKQPSDTENPPDRLIIVEDLSRDVVELLGSKYDIDPLFFLSHIGDYLFHNTRDRWVELPDLDCVSRRQTHFTLQYLRARYFDTPDALATAERESGAFNVLRRLDSDRSAKRLQNGLLDKKDASITLTRAKTSLWMKPRKQKDEPLLAVLLVDPTVKAGFPLWGGYRPFEDTPSMNSEDDVKAPSRVSLFEDVIFWSSRMTDSDLQLAREDPKCIAIPMIRLVLADWRTVLKYMTTIFGKIEWEIEKPHWGEVPNKVDKTLQKLSPWKRNIHYYKAMIGDAINRIFPPKFRNQMNLGSPISPPEGTGLLDLLHDFRIVQNQMEFSQQRIESIQFTATNAINIEEARRAVQQNKHLARLTFLATAFLPLNFTSSFLSMSPNFNASNGPVWLFFAIGLPLMILALLAVDLSRPKEGKVIRTLRKFKILRDKNGTRPTTATAAEKVPRAKTIPWTIERTPSGFRI